MQALLIATEDPPLPPLSRTIPAPLMPIVNRPVIVLAIELLARAGLKQIAVCVTSGAREIAAALGTGRRWGVQLSYLLSSDHEPALAAAARHVTDTTLVLPAAAILDLDVDEALAYHRAHGELSTAILHATRREDLAASPTGAYIVEPQALGALRSESFDQVSLLAEQVAVPSYTSTGYWNPLDSFLRYQEAQRVVLHSAHAAAWPGHPPLDPSLPRIRHPLVEGKRVAPGIWAGPNSTIARSARLTPPLVLGEHSRVGAGVELGPDVVVGANVIIDDEATVQRSTVLDSTYIGRLTCSRDRIIDQTTMVDVPTAARVQVVDPFLLDTVPSPDGGSKQGRSVSKPRLWPWRREPVQEREVYGRRDLSGANE